VIVVLKGPFCIEVHTAHLNAEKNVAVVFSLSTLCMFFMAWCL